MNIFQRIASAFSILASGKLPGPSDDYWYHPSGVSTQAGIDISEESALQILTVLACVSKISKTIASLPVHVFEKTGSRERRSTDHALNSILSGTVTASAKLNVSYYRAVNTG